MSADTPDRPFLRLILVWAAIVIIVAGMKSAASLVVPFLLSLFLAILCGPVLEWLVKRRLPQPLAMLFVLGGLCIIVLFVARVAVNSANSFIDAWPTKYAPRAEQITRDWEQKIRTLATDNPKLEAILLGEPSEETDAPPDAADPATSDASPTNLLPGTGDHPGEPVAPLTAGGSHPATPGVHWNELIEPDFLMRLFSSGMLALTGILSQTLLILVTTIFVLVEASTLPAKLRAISGGTDDKLRSLRTIAEEVNRYMAIKTSTSLLTGGLVASALWILDVDFALLWGMTAFLLNYVPNIGSIIAAVPAVLMTLLQHGIGTALLVIALYVAVNMFIGYFLEPRWMGRGLGLSTLVVFVSLVFWGWVLGPVGMVISVPLTMTVKIALEGSPETRWLAILMGPSVGPSSVIPAEPGIK